MKYNGGVLNGESIIFVSHRLGKTGGVMSEYAEDKLRCLQDFQNPTFVITALDSLPTPRENFKYFRIPSLSFYELKEQIKSLKMKDLPVPIQAYLMYPIASTLGRIFDLILEKKFRSSFGGFWGWSVASIPVVMFVSARYRIKRIFSTGGASAGLIGAICAKVLKLHFYYEIPDPIVSVTMNYSPRGLKRIKKLEHFLIENSRITTFVTQYAAVLAKKRCPSLVEKIQYVYPGSWEFFPQKKFENLRIINMVHIGSLYGTRNLNALFQALNELLLSPEYGNLTVKITNVGGLTSQNYVSPNNRIEFESFPEMDREAALNLAMNASILLLVQHKDERSKETIPYKVYDYLNLQIPILGIIDNPEISELLKSSSFYESPVDDLRALKSVLSQCFSSMKAVGEISFQKIDIKEQFPQIFGIIPLGNS